SFAYLASVSEAASTSTSTAIAEPLWPPNVASDPAIAVAASVVGSPSGPTAQPSGMGSPELRAASTLPKAPALVARSAVSAWSPALGAPIVSGFVPSTERNPPYGATTGPVVEVTIPIIPAAVMRSD